MVVRNNCFCYELYHTLSGNAREPASKGFMSCVYPHWCPGAAAAAAAAAAAGGAAAAAAAPAAEATSWLAD